MVYSIPAWSVPPDAVQPNGQKLDTLDGRFQSASIQSRNRIWNIHTIASGSRPVVRWYRLARDSDKVVSKITYSGASTHHLFNPSFVTNSGFDGSPAYIRVSRTIPPSPNAGRVAMLMGAGPNTTGGGWSWTTVATSPGQYAVDGFGNSCNTTSRGACRWGDYSSVTVDPDQAGTGWGFNQMINGSTQFDWYSFGAKKIYNLQSRPEALSSGAQSPRG